MSKIIIIGAGSVGRVTAYKCAQNKEIFSKIILASRTLVKCEEIAKSVFRDTGTKIHIEQVDANQIKDLVVLFKKYQPKLVIHVALPYQDLSIMEACLVCGVNYIDTANYEPLDEAIFSYKWQWTYQDRFKKAGILAVLGCGFDPGVTSVFTARAVKHHFDEIHYLDIVDCNAGEHGKPFATNFNPEINIREITQKGKYWRNKKWIFTEPHEVSKELTYPNIGKRKSYLIHHEELESLVKNYPSIKQARFWMTFGEEYLTHLRVIQNIGMASIHPIEYEGKKIVPLQFLKAVLPNPKDLGVNYHGETSIGCRIKGIKNNQEKTYYIWNNCSHQKAYQETGTQAISYTTGIPVVVGAEMILKQKWSGIGVFNVEEFDPDPFLEKMCEMGLPWNEKVNIDLEMG